MSFLLSSPEMYCMLRAVHSPLPQVNVQLMPVVGKNDLERRA